ncbi:histidine permease [Dothidotthia symphoricarpi CBS 119687]|uniref:Histidine permease n=1 Tax=Dothidotthia symphoricarpi CBS 119687 TaxID=1392245 RepID=A0A6A6A0U1_9PLEO|nr:histidine permease [Dothidotthia symphoricarpi CBS 119687]KAF2124171.1 histidine permease [Dothidotthia symphoricarpi CBS 119687]
MASASEEITPKMDNHSEKSAPHSASDVEKQSQAPAEELQRKLSSRHLQFVAIGGTVGTGVFIASGGSIATAGPVGALLAYVFVGTLVYSVMLSLAEMATYLPISGAFTQYAVRFVDPSLGFAMGWVYWLSWSITYALELVAAGLIVQWWNQDLSIGIFITIFWVPITLINFLPVDVFGEFEFWFALIKVVALVGFWIFAIIMNAGGVGPQGYIGFKYWKEPGAFAPYLAEGAVAKFVGFWAVLIQAGFAFQGTELCAIGAGESANPRKTMPQAIRRTFWSIFTLFVFTIFFIGILIPYDNENMTRGDTNAGSSPLVIAIQLAGVSALPDIFNAILLTVVLSAASSNVYSGSRILVGLAERNCAPAFFKRTTKRGVPFYATAATAAIGLLAYMNLSSNGSEVFNWLLNITAVAGFIAWSCVCICHLCFMRALKAQNIDRDTLPFKSWGGKYLAWYALIFCVIIIFTQGFTAFVPWSVRDFFIAYISLILFVILYVGHKSITRSKFVKATEADIFSGQFKEELSENWEESSASGWKKMFSKIF